MLKRLLLGSVLLGLLIIPALARDPVGVPAAPAATPAARVFVPGAPIADTGLTARRPGNAIGEENLSLWPGGIVTVSVTTPTGLGSKDPNTVRDGTLATTPQTQYDTFNGANQTFAWFGFVYTETLRFNALELQLGELWEDGGWFASGTSRIEVLSGTTWSPVTGVTWGGGGPPEAPLSATFGAPLKAYWLHAARFPTVTGRGIRVSGQPGRGNGQNAFVGIGELRAYYREQPPAAGEARWTMYRYDYLHTGQNPSETQISRSLVPRLTEKWQASLTPNLALTQTGVFATASISGGMVFVGSMDGTMHALRLSDGSEVWRRFTSHRFFNPEGGNGILSSVAIVGDRIYFGGDDATIWALRASDGSIVWQKRYINFADVKDLEAASAQSSPMVVGDTLYIGISNGTADVPCTIGRVLALRTSDGTKLWETPMTVAGKEGAGVWSTVAVDQARNRLYVSTGNSCSPTFEADHDNSILALNMTTGAIEWAYQHIAGDTQDLDFGSSPVIFEGKAAALSKSGFLPAIDLATGQEVWRVPVATANASPYDGGGVNSPSYAYGKVFVGGGPINGPPDSPVTTYRGSFLAVNPVNGAVLWRIPLNLVPFGASAVANRVVFIADDKDLLALDTETGAILKRIKGDALMWGGITITGGFLLVGDQNGVLHCYSIDGF